jgi:hypothetical protein
MILSIWAAKSSKVASCEGALCRACDPLYGFDANDGRDDCIFKPVIGFAEVFLHGLGIEATGDLIGGRDSELAASNIDEAPALKFVLKQFALGLCTFQDGIGMAERVGKRRVSKVVKAGWGYDRNVRSLGHGSLRWLGLEPGECSTTCSACNFMTLYNHEVNNK